MLTKLYIKNYGLFDETEIEVPAGLNILTGETGAGKSLLVGALGLIIGKRLDNSAIFLSDDKCIIEALFKKLSASIVDQLTSIDEFDLEDDTIIIRREARPNGKSRAFVNDTPVSLQTLRQVGEILLDLHGQHENQYLLSADKQIDLLDDYAGCETEVTQFRQLLGECHSLEKEIHELEAREASMRQQYDFLSHQVKELEEAQLQPNEEEDLEQEIKLLQNAEDIRESLDFAVNQLYHQDVSIYSQLSEVTDALDKIQDVNKELENNYQKMVEAQEILKDVTFSLQDFLETADSDPERLNVVEERLGLYHSLKLKHGVKTGAELVARYEQLSGQLQEVDSMDDRIDALTKTYQEKIDVLTQQGLRIEEIRIEAKSHLEQSINQLLTEVGFKKARFEIQIDRNFHESGDLTLDGQAIKANANGINQVNFLIQTNPGVPAGPLAQIASGGEISRVMLAVKAALADKSEFPVLIFDEIDTGISGEIANKVGNVMHQLAARFQILAITHLPQIAARGDQHFKLIKNVEGDKTTSTVKQLSLVGRVHELATMMSGEHPTESALRSAQEMIAATQAGMS